MSDRALKASGISLPSNITNAAAEDTAVVETTIDSTTIAAASAQVNPHHDILDLLSPKRKKLCQKSTEDLRNYEKHDSDAKGIINFVELAEIKGEDFVWKSIATNIVPENTCIFSTLGKLVAEYFKNHCDPK